MQKNLDQSIEELANLFYKSDFQGIIGNTEQLTTQFPDSYIIWNIRGAAFLSLKNLEHSFNCFMKVIELNPNYPDGFNNLGLTLNRLKRYKEAIRNYQIAISLNENYAQAYNNLGQSLREVGDHRSAITYLNKSLSLIPDYPEAYYNLGNCLIDQEKTKEALAHFRKCISIAPNFLDSFKKIGSIMKTNYSQKDIVIFFDDLDKDISSFPKKIYIPALIDIGNVLKNLNVLKHAIRFYNKAVSLKPDYAIAFNNLGATYRKMKDFNRAIAYLEKALSIDASYLNATINLGTCYLKMQDYNKAIICFKKALKLDPKSIDALTNCSAAYRYLQDNRKSLSLIDKAIEIEPTRAESWNNRSVVLHKMAKFDAAHESLITALNYKNGYPEAKFNQALLYCLKGDLSKGLELYEARFFKKEGKTRPPKKNLMWNGKSSIKGKKFHVYAEQGIGDTFLFCRYLILLYQKGADIYFNVNTKLHKVLKTLDINVNLIDTKEPDIIFDYESPLMSLPFLFKTTLNTIPVFNKYLHPETKKMNFWKNYVTDDKFKIGICWQGSKNLVDIGRSFELSHFEKISRLSNVELISLHKGEGESQITEIDFKINSLNKNFDSSKDAFVDSAAVIATCDLIITSDTAIAHLSGALGVSCWVLLQYVPDWRWFLKEETSPWYPNTKLFRQTKNGDWESVFKNVYDELLTIT